jgi:hypothetical protein
MKDLLKSIVSNMFCGNINLLYGQAYMQKIGIFDSISNAIQHLLSQIDDIIEKWR